MGVVGDIYRQHCQPAETYEGKTKSYVLPEKCTNTRSTQKTLTSSKPTLPSIQTHPPTTL